MTPTPAAFPAQMDLSKGKRILNKAVAADFKLAHSDDDAARLVAKSADAKDELLEWCEANLPSLIAAARERDALRADLEYAERALDEIATDQTGSGIPVETEAASYLAGAVQHLQDMAALALSRITTLAMNREQSEGAVG